MQICELRFSCILFYFDRTRWCVNAELTGLCVPTLVVLTIVEPGIVPCYFCEFIVYYAERTRRIPRSAVGPVHLSFPGLILILVPVLYFVFAIVDIFFHFKSNLFKKLKHGSIITGRDIPWSLRLLFQKLYISVDITPCKRLAC